MIYPSTPENIALAAAALHRGELVAFPTETVYGLGASALDATAVAKIYELKGRPRHNPIIVHIADLTMLDSVADVRNRPELCELIDKLAIFWPGPLSLVLPKSSGIPAIVSAGLDSVAVRIPSHPVAHQLIRAARLPLAAPSANPASYISPTSAVHVHDSFGEKLEFILDGGFCQVGVESTVLSLLENPPRLLRPGGVSLEELQKLLGTVLSEKAEAGADLLSPGLLPQHYAPSTPLAFRYEIPAEQWPAATALISFSREQEELNDFDFTEVCRLSDNGDLEQIAAGLFAALRTLDTKGYDLILIDSCPEQGLGLAIMDRLRRATSAASRGCA